MKGETKVSEKNGNSRLFEVEVVVRGCAVKNDRLYRYKSPTGTVKIYGEGSEFCVDVLHVGKKEGKRQCRTCGESHDVKLLSVIEIKRS
jgi:hypothetical protein